MSLRSSFGWLAVGLALAAPLRGQAPPAAEGPPPWEGTEPIATLSVWAEETWFSLLDREGAWFGPLAEEGVLQRFNPLMDAEYELDLRTALFTPAEDARWARLGTGLRAAGASISHPYMVNLLDWRQEIPVAGPVDVRARYRRERSFTARRDHPRLGIRWSGMFGSPWGVEAGMGVHFFKPAADFELAVHRTWGHARGRAGAAGQGRIELRLAALDAFNNLILNRLGVREDIGAHLDYQAPPRAVRLAAHHVTPRWRLELHAGGTNRSEVEARFPLSGEPTFTQREDVRFGGLVVQVNPTPRWSLALQGSAVRADLDRVVADAPTDGFSLREETRSVGLRQRLFVTGSLAVEAELDRTWRPEDRAPVGGEAVEHRDRSTFVLVALVRHPRSGWTGRIAWALMNRDAGRLAPELEARNRRLVTNLGYRFASGFEITLGTGWDIDAFDRRRFDGGHLRVMGTW